MRCSAPNRFMAQFERSLNVLLDNGESEILFGACSAWRDSVTVAAEIEALTAYRALVHWGTSWGKLVYRYSSAA